MKLFVGSLKIVGLTFIVALMSLHASVATAKDISQCNYDEVVYGSGAITINKDTYFFEFEDEIGNSYVFNGFLKDPLFAEIKDSLATAKPTPQGDKNIVLMMSMNKPVCASLFNVDSLYVQPGLVEKDTYYSIGVCTPETDDCWKMKINKKSVLGGGQLKGSGKLPEEGKVSTVYSSPGGDIFSLYENSDF